MTRFVFRIILSLGFLLLGENAHLYAHALGHEGAYSHNSSIKSYVRHGLSVLHNDKSYFSAEPAPEKQKEKDKKKGEEVEDEDDWVASRKYFDATIICFTVFYALATGFSFHFIQSRLPFCKHFSYSSSNKYILHRVIRI